MVFDISFLNKKFMSCKNKLSILERNYVQVQKENLIMQKKTISILKISRISRNVLRNCSILKLAGTITGSVHEIKFKHNFERITLP